MLRLDKIRVDQMETWSLGPQTQPIVQVDRFGYQGKDS